MSSDAGRRDVGEHVWLIAMAAAGAVPAAFLAAKGGVEVLLLPAALAGILVLLPRPDLAAQTLAFVLYLNASDVLIERNGWPSLDKGLVVLVATAVVLRWWASGRRPGGDPQTVAVLAIYAVTVAAPMIFALEHAPSGNVLLDTAKHIAIALLIVAAATDIASVRMLVWALVAAGLVLGGAAAVTRLAPGSVSILDGFAGRSVQQIVGEVDSGRLVGPLDDPNSYAQVLVALVPFAWNRMLDARSPGARVIAAASLALVTAAVFATYSRGGLLALAIVVTLLLFLWHWRHLGRALLVAGLVAGLTATLVPEAYRERTVALFGLLDDADGPKDAALIGRRDEMVAALAMAGDHPLLGVGPGNYERNFQTYSRRLDLWPRQENRQAYKGACLCTILASSAAASSVGTSNTGQRRRTALPRVPAIPSIPFMSGPLDQRWRLPRARCRSATISSSGSWRAAPQRKQGRRPVQRSQPLRAELPRHGRSGAWRVRHSARDRQRAEPGAQIRQGRSCHALPRSRDRGCARRAGAADAQVRPRVHVSARDGRAAGMAAVADGRAG